MTSRMELERFTPMADRLVAVDSDGCAFDTMEIKWKECFIPRAIEHLGLQPVAAAARRCLEFVNLYSRSRGVNRFFGLEESLDWLGRLPVVAARGFRVPSLARLRAWTADNPQPTTGQLAELAAADPDPELAAVLAWSEAANADIARVVHGVPPFSPLPGVLERLAGRADVVVVSSTPVEALEREWREHGIAEHAALICGQETGGKREVLGLAAAGYEPDRVLMIGDAPGDRGAAAANGVHFYPVLPGREEASWERFAAEAMARFLADDYGGAYEEDLVAAFAAVLPDRPDFLDPGPAAKPA